MDLITHSSVHYGHVFGVFKNLTNLLSMCKTINALKYYFNRVGQIYIIYYIIQPRHKYVEV